MYHIQFWSNLNRWATLKSFATEREARENFAKATGEIGVLLWMQARITDDEGNVIATYQHPDADERVVS